ncbi:MAG: N-acetylmuramoyl-L-alanine amidase [Pseudomonadota bacterium]
MAALALAVTAFLAVDVARAAETQVIGVRTGVNAEATRFVLDVSTAVDYQISTLENPYRVVIDLPEVAWQIPEQSQQVSTGLIDGFRFGPFEPGRSRIVLDVSGPVSVQRVFILEPSASFSYRFVLDLVAAQEEPGVVPEPVVDIQQTSVQVPESTFDVPVYDGPPLPGVKPNPDRFVIVVDPGHGGVDPGAIGHSGIYEKDIVLDAARELKRQLEATGRYTVVLTRDSDIFLRLAERVEIARASGADLFISVHADSMDDSSMRGAGVYTLSETASDDEAAALAAKENKADLIAGVDFVNVAYDPLTTDILIDLAQRETTNASAQFARLLTAQLQSFVKLRSNAHRFAGFRVLKAPDVPSVLVELGYMSNADEESKLKTESYRRDFMSAITAAIDVHFQDGGY